LSALDKQKEKKIERIASNNHANGDVEILVHSMDAMPIQNPSASHNTNLTGHTFYSTAYLVTLPEFYLTSAELLAGIGITGNFRKVT